MNLVRPVAFLDLETTGIDPQNSRIVEIGVSIVHPDGAVKPKGWSQRINPTVPIPAEATAIHGITDADVAACPKFEDLAAKIHKALLGKDIAGYSLWMLDLPILDCELRRCGHKLDITNVNVLDV